MSIEQRFAGFFAEVNNGRNPYPWQRELVNLIAQTGRWPDISAPTGSGKSSVIDAHVFLVAEHAAGRLRVRPPRRLILVAPRRVLVDDQFDRAGALAGMLQQALGREDGSRLGQVARVLQGLNTAAPAGEEPPPLGVWRLRGGVVVDNGWRLEPAACQVLCATPLMWGSRLLLRGYGATRNSRNLEAGLLGQDAVAIIDEAHLHERLVDTARNVATRTPSAMGLQVVAMSATRPPAAGQIGLSPADLQDQELTRRVTASKEIELVDVADWRRDAPKAVVEQARLASTGTGTVGVFVNDVPTALNVAAALGEGGERVVELVCGRLRRVDVSRLRARRPGLLTPAGDPEVDFLVSTQSLEVGVDLDLPAMVTTIASASALAQRAGRLNRSGKRPSSKFFVVSPEGARSAEHDSLPPAFGPYERGEIVAAARWLDALQGSISPEAVAASVLPLADRQQLPALRDIDLETLSMTSDVQAADPDVALYLEEPERARAEVHIVARRHLDLEREVVATALRACPPRGHEVATVAFSKTLDRIVAAVDKGEVKPWVVRVIDGHTTAVTLAEAEDLRTGDSLVVPHGARICTAGVVGVGEGQGATGALDEVLEAAPDGGSADRIVALSADEVDAAFALDAGLGTRASRTALAGVLEEIDPDLARRLRSHRRLSELELQWCGGESAAGLLVLRDLRQQAEQTPRVVPDEEISVDAHQVAVERRMIEILKALDAEGLGATEDQLRLAAFMHDDGKRHPRFQRRMGAVDVELAKPRPGHLPDQGDGWRHEQLSAAYAAAACDSDPIVVTLVAGHHGRGRWLFDRGGEELLDGWTSCPEEVLLRTQRLFGPCGWYEADRAQVQRQLGVHRLAFLEALLRCADIQVSREGG